MTPGLNPSIKTSAVSTNFLIMSCPSGFLMSTAIDFFPLEAISELEPLPAAVILSTEITSAPISAKIIPQNGAGPIPAISITFISLSGPIYISPKRF